MKRIIITGATGNIGYEVIRFLCKITDDIQIIAAVRNIEKARPIFKEFENLDFVTFDFENPDTFYKALNNIDCVFLLRPPHISEVDKYFKPLIDKIKDEGIKQIIFLSVQGVEKSKVIPHNKIEKLIVEQGFDYIFLRPSYFMQNLTTTLLDDIQRKRKIILPAGRAKFNWIDAENIGEAAAMLIDHFDEYKNQAIELTGYENKDFYEVAEMINCIIEEKIDFFNANPFRFFRMKKKDGMSTGMIIVMIMLHLIPRFQKEPGISDFFEKLTGKKPSTLNQFIEREKRKFVSQ